MKNQLGTKNKNAGILTRPHVFSELDTKVKVALVSLGIIPVGLLTYIGYMSGNIGGASNLFGIDISQTRSSFFYESSGVTPTIFPGGAQLVIDPALAHSGSYSLKFTAQDYLHPSQSYFNYVGVKIGEGDVFEFYIRSAEKIFNAAGASNALGVVLTYSGETSTTSQLIDITPQFPGNVVTTEYKKIEIPFEIIAGGFAGKMRSLTLSVKPSLVGSGQSFLVDDITVKRQLLNVPSSSTKATTLSSAVYKVSTSSAMVSWPQVSGSTGYKVYLATQPSYLTNPNFRLLVGSLPGAQTSYKLLNLTPNKDYYIRIEADGVAKAYQSNKFHTCPLWDKACIAK